MITKQELIEFDKGIGSISVEMDRRIKFLNKEIVLLEEYVSKVFKLKIENTLTDFEERDLNKAQHGMSWLNHYFKCVEEDVKVFPEYIVYDTDLQLAGQIDLLVEHPKTKVVDLIDYKTNAEIKKTGYNNATMKPPLSALPDCSYYKYMLQLSMYAYMLEKRGYTIGDLILVHLKEDAVKSYTMKYDKESILKIIK
jgi:ATP-dependent exoDNAse (exonuclease V) beta subunit